MLSRLVKLHPVARIVESRQPKAWPPWQQSDRLNELVRTEKENVFE